MCAKYGLSSPAAVVEAMGNTDPAEREKALRTAFSSEMGWFKKTVTLFGRRSAAEATSAHADTFEGLRTERARIMQENGSFIATLVSDDPRMREALTTALYKEKVVGGEKVKRVSLAELSDAVPDEEGVQEEWETYKKSVKWDKMPAGKQRNTARSAFEADYKKKHNFPQTGGFWASIIGLLCKDFFGPKNLK